MRTPTVYNTEEGNEAFIAWVNSQQKYNIERRNVEIMHARIAANFYGKRNARIRKYGQAENHTLEEY